jgi:hypothetical protein
MATLAAAHTHCFCVCATARTSFAGIKVISIAGTICGRAVPVKTRDHILPLTDMYANRRIAKKAGPSLEAINQVRSAISLHTSIHVSNTFVYTEGYQLHA